MSPFPESLPLRALLAIPAALYGVAVRARNVWYDRPERRIAAEVPVVSIGNLAAGGTGKTPLVAWIARRLLAQGLNPAVVSRGYGGTAGPGPLIVSSGAGPRVDARAGGDEPVMLARQIPRALVVVGADRREAARAAAGLGASVVLLDDGFQHRRLARDLDLVVLDGRAPFGNGRLLPSGPLREPAAAIRRASAVLLSRLAPDDGAPRAVEAVRAAGFAGPIVRCGHVAAGFSGLGGAPAEAPARAVAFCGIGDPERFRSDLADAGVEVAAFRPFRDHHVYSPSERDALLAEAKRLELPLVTTAKDLARLESRRHDWAGVPIAALGIEARVWDEATLLDLVRKAIATRR